MSTSEHKLRPNTCDWVAGTSTNKAGAAAVGMVATTATPAVGPAVVGVEVEVVGMAGAGVAETVGAPTPMPAAATNECEQVQRMCRGLQMSAGGYKWAQGYEHSRGSSGGSSGAPHPLSPPLPTIFFLFIIKILLHISCTCNTIFTIF